MAGDDDEATFQETMRIVRESQPAATLSDKDWRVWSKKYAGKVVKIKGQIRDVNLKAGFLVLESHVSCFLARDQEKLWSLNKGTEVVIKGMLPNEVPKYPSYITPGAELYGCVILKLEQQKR